jgi:hypothetical protein
MVRVKSTLIKTAGDQIAELPQQDTVTPYEMIKELAPIIIEARKRGHDFRAIAKILEGHGVRLAPATVRNYLDRVRRESEVQQQARPNPRQTTPTRSTATAPNEQQPNSNPSTTTADDAHTHERGSPRPGTFAIKRDRPDL